MRYTTFSLIALSLLSAYWYWHNQHRPTQVQPISVQDTPLLILEYPISIHYDTQGQANLILSANQLTHYNDPRATTYYTPKIDYHTPDTQHIQLTAQQAHLNQAQTQLQFQGQVQVQSTQHNQRQYWLQTPQLNYQIEQQTLDTNAPIELNTPQSQTTAQGAYWTINQPTITLKQAIRSRYAPKS